MSEDANRSDNLAKSGYTNVNAVQAEWIDKIVRIQALAQSGLAYSTNRFDIERYEELRELTAWMLADLADLPLEKVRGLFLNEQGYQTPKIVVRTAIFQADKILLVQELNEQWSVPGGWADVNYSVKENAVKEVKEEAGLDCRVEKLVAVMDRNKHKADKIPYGITECWFIAENLGGEFVENNETLNSGYFALADLPVLDERKATQAQIELCFSARREDWQVICD